MKRYLVIVLCMLLVVSGCGPAAKTTNTTTQTEQKPAASEIVPTVVTHQDPEPVEEPEDKEKYLEVQIDMDNWQEYFYVEEFEEWLEKDSVAYKYMKGYRLVLKDEYVQRLYEDEDINFQRLNVGVQESYHTWNVTVDYDKREYTLGEKHQTYEPTDEPGVMKYNDLFSQKYDCLVEITKDKPYTPIAYGSFSKDWPLSEIDEILEMEITSFDGVLMLTK